MITGLVAVHTCLSVDAQWSQAIQVGALARDVVLCSWARHLTLTVPPFTQAYKWEAVN